MRATIRRTFLAGLLALLLGLAAAAAPAEADARQDDGVSVLACGARLC